MTNFEHISAAMGLMAVSDATNETSSDSAVLGNMLYAGAYSPKVHESDKPQYQNFVSHHIKRWNQRN